MNGNRMDNASRTSHRQGLHARLTGLLGPMFAKEMIEIARRRRYFLLRVVFGVALLWTMAAMWGNTGWGGRRSQLPSHPAALVAGVVDYVAIAQFAAVCLLVPLLVCDVICGERSAGTLELLFTTDLRDRDIVFGKLGSRLATATIVVASGLPPICFLMFLGGISWPAIWLIELATFIATVWAGAVAVLYSSRCRHPFFALLFSYATLGGLLLAFVPSPLPALWVAMSANRLQFDWLLGAWEFVAAATLPILIAAGCVAATITRLRREPPRWNLRAYRGIFGIGRQATSKKGPAPRERAYFSEDRGYGTEPIPVSEPLADEAVPVVQRQRSMWGPLQIPFPDERPLRQNHQVLLVILAALVFCGFLFLVHGPGVGGVIVRILIPLWLAVLVLTAIVAVTSPIFARRPGFFDLLLSTTLGPREILQGCVMVSWPLVVRLYLAPWQLSVFWCLGNPLGVCLAALVGTAFGGLTLALGTLCSLTSQRPAERLLPTLGFALGLMVLPNILPAHGVADAGLLCWLAAVALTAVTWVWTRFQMSAPAISTHFIAVHLLLVTTLVSLPMWGLENRQVWQPGFLSLSTKSMAAGSAHRALSPSFWLDHALREVYAEGWRDARREAEFLLLPLYVLALLLQLFWTRRWALRNFDLLVGRSHPDPRILAFWRRARSRASGQPGGAAR